MARRSGASGGRRLFTATARSAPRASRRLGKAAGTNTVASMPTSSSRSMRSSTTCPTGRTPVLIDELMPVYDVSDAVGTVVDPDVAATASALLHVALDRALRSRRARAALAAAAGP